MSRFTPAVTGVALGAAVAGCGAASDTGSGARATTRPTTASTTRSATSTHSTPRTSTRQVTPKGTSGEKHWRHPQKRHAVIRVVDGDTLHVAYRGDTAIRVIGIDTPETYGTDECYSHKATKRAEHLLTGQRVTLRFDRSQGRLDKYGRTLAYVGLPDSRDFGRVMIHGGYATEYTYDEPYRKRSRYGSVQTRAQSRSTGLWGKCGGPHVAKHPATHEPAHTHHSGGNGGGGEKYPVPPPPPDLDCSDVDASNFPVRLGDPHGFDADGAGIGCES